MPCCGQVARGGNPGPPRRCLSQSVQVSSCLCTLGPPPPLLLPPAVPWPSDPGTAATCLGDPQAVITIEQPPFPQDKEVREKEEVEVWLHAAKVRNQLRRAVLQDRPWGPVWRGRGSRAAEMA